MILVALILSCVEYLGIRYILLKFTNIKLDILPDRYYNDPKRNWTNIGIFLMIYLITSIIFILLFGFNIFDIPKNPY